MTWKRKRKYIVAILPVQVNCPKCGDPMFRSKDLATIYCSNCRDVYETPTIKLRLVVS
jgi:transcription elongation factor Elf1